MGISKIEVITGMSKLTNLISELSKVGVRGVTVMQVLGCGIELEQKWGGGGGGYIGWWGGGGGGWGGVKGGVGGGGGKNKRSMKLN